MKLKFNLQSALVSCFVTIMLSMAIDQDVNAFVAAPFQRNSSEPSSEAPVQVAETSTSETETTSETFYEARVSSYSKQLHRPVEQNQMKIHRPFRLQNQKV